MRFNSASFGLNLYSIRFCLRIRSILTVLPVHSVMTSCSIPFGLCLGSTQFKSSHSVSLGFSYAAAYFKLSLSPTVTFCRVIPSFTCEIAKSAPERMPYNLRSHDVFIFIFVFSTNIQSMSAGYQLQVLPSLHLNLKRHHHRHQGSEIEEH